MPPAIWKAGIEMPMKPSTLSPKIPKSVSKTVATMQARRPMRRRICGVLPLVSAMNSGTMPIGSMITKSVTKAVIRAAVSMPPQ